MNLKALEVELLGALLDQTAALDRAESLMDAAEYAGWSSIERLRDLADDAMADAQEAGLRARDLREQLDAFQQGMADAARGFGPDVDPRDVRPQDRDAIAYLAGFQAASEATTAA